MPRKPDSPFPGGKRAPKTNVSDVLAAYRHVAKTEKSTKERPDTPLESTIRQLKAAKVDVFLKNMNENELAHAVKNENRRKEADARRRELKGKDAEALDGTSEKLVEHIDRLLGEYAE